MKNMTYKNESEINAVVESFENCTISRKKWKHAEHLTVALFYLSKNDFKTAYAKMRKGIFKLLKSFEIDLSKEMPYHETLTVFWLKTVENFKMTEDKCSNLELHNKLVANFDKNYPLRFYSRELLFSEKARGSFVEADLPTNQRD